MAVAALASASMCLALLFPAVWSFLHLRRGAYDPVDVLVLLTMIGSGTLAFGAAMLAVILGALGLLDCARPRSPDARPPRGAWMAGAALTIGAVPITGYALLRLYGMLM